MTDRMTVWPIQASLSALPVILCMARHCVLLRIRRASFPRKVIASFCSLRLMRVLRISTTSTAAMVTRWREPLIIIGLSHFSG